MLEIQEIPFMHQNISILTSSSVCRSATQAAAI